MALTLPTGREGRLLALGLLLAVVVAFVAGVLEPVLGLYAERRDTLAQRAQMAHHMARLAAELPRLRARAAQSTETGASAMLPGDSDAVAAARLQELVQGMAATAGAALQSAEVLPVEQTGAHRRIALKVSCETAWPMLVSLLAQVAQSETPLLVDDLQIHGNPGAAAGQAVTIDADFTIYGFRQADQP